MSSENKNNIYATIFSNFFDSATMVAVGLSLPAWTASLNITSLTIGILCALGVSAFGGAFGSLLSGVISDKYGRLKAYKMGVYCYPVGLLLVILSNNIYLLLAGIVIVGLSVGVSVPVSWNYLAEKSNQKKRSVNLGFSQISRPAGIALMYLLFFLFSSIFKALNINTSSIFGFDYQFLCSKILFIFLLVISIACILNSRKLTETKYWLNSNDSKTSAKLSKSLKLLNSKKIALSFMFLILIYAPWNITASTLGQFAPTFATLGSIESSNFALISLSTLPFQFISVIVFTKIVKKFGYRSLYVAGNLIGELAILMLLLFCIQIDLFENSMWWTVILFCFIWNSQAGFSGQCFYTIWSSELFPTEIRGKMQGIMFFLVRSLCGVWSIFVIGNFNITSADSAIWVVLLLIGLLAISLVTVMIFCPNTKNKSLDEISEERYGRISKKEFRHA